MSHRQYSTVAQLAKEGGSPTSGLLPILPGKAQADGSSDKPPLPRGPTKKLDRGKVASELSQDLQRKREKRKDGAVIWETAPPLEVPQSLQTEEEPEDSKGAPGKVLHPVAELFRAPLRAISEQHLAAVVGQLLRGVGIDDVGQWTPIITRLATDAAACLSPQALGASGAIDPRFYIKVKRLADTGRQQDSCLVRGVTCRKNLTHRKMRKHITAPRILMLGSNFEFHRTQGRLASFDHYTKDQETEHLRLAVERLADMAPDVLLVEKSVARDAQDALLAADISLALNVKRSILDRLARCTGVQVASSLSQLTQACVAVCEEFEVEEFPSMSCHSLMGGKDSASPVGTLVSEPAQISSTTSQQLPSEATGKPAGAASLTPDVSRLKLAAMTRSLPADPAALPTGRGLDSRSLTTRGSADAATARGPLGPRTLMYFKGCPKQLGCTIILKGASAEELAGVKKVMQFASYCAYRGRVETALLATELASAAAVCDSPQPSALPSPTVQELGSPACQEPTSPAPMQPEEDASNSAHPYPEAPRPAGQQAAQNASSSFEGCSEEEIKQQASNILSRAAVGRDGITSASPHCCEEAAESYTVSMPPSPMTPARPSPPDTVAEPTPESVPKEPPTAVMEPSDPLSLAARELMLTRQASQESSAMTATDMEEELADLRERAAASRLLDSQRLFVSVAKRNRVKGLVCEPPKVHRIEYYRASDMPLAAFLAQSAAALGKRCAGPECGEGQACHTTSYLHAKGLITVTVTQLAEGRELPGGEQGLIWFWARPTQDGPSAAAGAWRVVLPTEAANISLGHFLELGLEMAGCSVRGRRLHREFARYFGIGSCLVCFQYEHVSPNSVLMPPHQTAYSLPVQQHWLEEEVDELIEEHNTTFNSINEALSKLEGSDEADKGGGARQLLRNELSSEGEVLSKAILEVCGTVRTETPHSAQAGPGSSAAALDDLVAAVWAINSIRRSLAHMSHAWSARLQHPATAAAAAARLGMSRASSYEELTSSTAGGAGQNAGAELGSRTSDEKFGAREDATPPNEAGHFLASHNVAPSPSPPSRSSVERPEAPNAGESHAEDVTVDETCSDASPAAADGADEEELASGQLSPTRQALLNGSQVSERVAALEAAPLLRTISKPGWATRGPRRRSATDTVLSWLNAGRRSRATALSTEDATTGQHAEQQGSDEEDLQSETATSTSPASSPQPRTGTGSAAMSHHSPAHRDLGEEQQPGPHSKVWQTATPACTPAEQPSGAATPTQASEPLEGAAGTDKGAGAAVELRPPESKFGESAGDESARPAGNIMLAREDSQLTSHFDVNYWDSMLKDQGQRSASAPSDLAKAAATAAQEQRASLATDLPAKAVISPAAVPLSVPPGPPGLKPPAPPSEAISSLNLQLTSALTAILTARKSEPSTASTPSRFGQLQGRSMLPQGVNERTIVVRDDEPTSLVAYFLSTREHQSYLDDAVTHLLFGAPKPSGGLLQRTARGNHSSEQLSAIDALTARPLGSEPSQGSIKITGSDEHSASGGVQNGRQRQKDGEGEKWDPAADWRVLVAADPLHFTGVLQDESKQPPGKARLQVTAWFAPQFAELRRRCCEGGEAAYICSLSRCRTWDARGGKTRSYFAKTADSRYIVKQLQASEKKSFQEIAPAYFRYLAGCMRRGASTCLAKIMGVYTVSVRPANGKESVMDILVMENIFYDRELFPIYDLKGSERARLARDDPSDPTRVLLDQNLKQSNLNDPILVEQGVHAELERALWSDTAFLSGLGVMDYSLLVGVDRSSNTLVVGIIDFIRQYTWDKALERWVKSGMGLSKDLKAPTIQSPKEYCRRFRVAMASYFTRVPGDSEPPAPLDPDSNLEILSWKGASLP